MQQEHNTTFKLMAQESKVLKWEGNATVDLLNIKAEQVWPFIEDFCNIHKWLPVLEKCDHIEGVHGKPGLVRYCVFMTAPSSPGSDKQIPANWCYEKLVSMDPIKRSLTYSITENNLGLTSYIGEMKVIDIDQGCRIEWPYNTYMESEWKLEDFNGFRNSILKCMAEKIEKEIQIRITEAEKMKKELKPDKVDLMEKEVQAISK